MDLNLDKHRPLFFLILFIAVSFSLIIFQGHKGKRSNSIIQSASVIFSPIHKLSVTIVRGVKYIWSDYINLVKVRQENKELKHRIEILKSLNTQYSEAIQANKRLRKLLEFRKKIEDATISAEIIGKDASNWYKSLLLDKGGLDKICINMPVVTYNGVVGKVLEVTNHTSKVLLINDVNSSIAVLIQRTRAEGILAGTGKDYCIIKYLRRDAEVRKGDRVITSGIGGIFPKGLLVGTVSKVQENAHALFQYIEVIPEAPIAKLEEAFIIKRTSLFNINADQTR